MNAAIHEPVVDFGGGDGGMTEDDWNDLLAEIAEGQCTPFLGAGASTPLLPNGAELAAALAKEFKLEVDVNSQLPRVAQNISLLGRDLAMRRFIKTVCDARGHPDFGVSTQLHRVLARLPLSIYVTTNYDNFMALALLETVKKKPIVELCTWFSQSWNEPESGIRPVSRAAEASEGTPLVYHLHGAFSNLASMVLTEDDYLDFLTVNSVKKAIVPSNVESSFVEKTLLFLGYSLEDMTFKVLLRRIFPTIRRSNKPHLTVQLRPDSVPITSADVQRIKIRETYVRKLLGDNARVYWGSCETFAAELGDRWNHYLTR